jgi:hypothetical protein
MRKFWIHGPTSYQSPVVPRNAFNSDGRLSLSRWRRLFSQRVTSKLLYMLALGLEVGGELSIINFD